MTFKFPDVFEAPSCVDALMVFYTLSGAPRCSLLASSQEDFFACCMEFAPPPPELKMVEKSLQESTKRGRKGKKNAAVNTPEVSTGSDEPNGVVVERVAHGDLGDEKQGRWRASLAESGKVRFTVQEVGRLWSCLMFIFGKMYLVMMCHALYDYDIVF